MRTSAILVSLALGVGLIGGGLAPSLAGEHRVASSNERQWLSIGQVHAKLEAAGYRNIEKIEREHGIYEARATDANEARVKLYINPQTGEVTDRGNERRRREREGTSNTAGEGAQPSASSSRNPADCNKRRCRDDLPTNAAGAASTAVSPASSSAPSSPPSSTAPAAR